MKSKKRSKITTGKSQLEPPTFFLDRTFGKTKLVGMLRQNGLIIVTHFEEYGDEGHKIGDPAIIEDCGRKNRVLLTGDKDLPRTYAREIRNAKIAVFVTTDNNEGPAKWGPRIITSKQGIWRELARRAKPFTAVISKEGKITQVRIYEAGKWKTIRIGEKNPPHANRQKKAEPVAVEFQGGSNGHPKSQTASEAKRNGEETKEIEP